MAIGPIVTRGFGSFGSAALVVVRGFLSFFITAQTTRIVYVAAENRTAVVISENRTVAAE